MFIIPCDFIIMGMDKNFRVPLILGKPFLTTTGAVIDVQAGTIFLQMCGERVDFYFPPPTPSSVPVIPPPSVVPPNALLRGNVFDGDEGPHMWSGNSSTFSAAIPISFGLTSASTGEEEDHRPHLHSSINSLLVPLSSTI